MPENPTDLELQVLAVIWRRHEATVREVLDALPDGRPRAYTTVLSTLQTMERKGLVKSQRQGAANRYSALVQQDAVLGSLLRRLVRNAFGGRPTAVMQCLLGETKISPEELAELRQIIETHAESPANKSRKKKGDQ